MPLMNYCKKCKAEVPSGDACPFCGAKLTKTGERLSFGGEHIPVRDWFCWNAMLRIVVPVIALVLLLTIVIEGALDGMRGIASVFLQGFFLTLLAVFGVLLLCTWLALALQRRDWVHFVLDAKGVHAFTYLKEPTKAALRVRLLNEETIARLQAENEDQLVEGLTLICRSELAWTDVKRVRFWAEASTVLFFRPRWWQAMYVRCSAEEFADVEASVT